jgi:hypothetical protein
MIYAKREKPKTSFESEADLLRARLRFGMDNHKSNGRYAERDESSLLYKAVTFLTRRRPVNVVYGVAGAVVFFTYKWFSIGNYSLKFHNMVRGDELGCYHSHHASAFRIVLKGGYLEQVVDQTGLEQNVKDYVAEDANASLVPRRQPIIPINAVPYVRLLKRFSFGRVKWDYVHRLDRVAVNTWSLWIIRDAANAKRVPVILIGEGYTNWR